MTGDDELTTRERGLAGRVAVITGGAAGFGLAVAEQLLAEDAKVVIVDRDEAALAAAVDRLGKVTGVHADVSIEADVVRYMATACERHGTVDLFFNNAGIEGKLLPMTEMDVADFDRVMAVNARGAFLGLREALRIMKPRGSGPYVASKHAVIGLTKCAALEGAPFGVRVNAVAPGDIDTRMARDLTRQINPDDPESVARDIAARIPLGRYGEADEVARLVVWLLSDEASYVTGSTHMIDGGLTA
jgi:3alpha(or 20beta)-hydroxysteroid dehydrogenase